MAALAGALMLAGCYIADMTLENQTGRAITVFCHGTTNTLYLARGRTGHVPQVSGSISVSVTNGPTWHYTSLSWFDNGTNRQHLVKQHPILYKGTRAFLIDTNGFIWILPPERIGWNHRTFRKAQPEGWPVKPAETNLPNEASQDTSLRADPER